MAGEYEILGLGAPLIDQVIEVKDHFLEQVTGFKGGMQLINYSTLLTILKSSGTVPSITTGGSSANTIKGLANLGRQCAIVGKIGTDEMGKKIMKMLKEHGIKSLCLQTSTPTGQVLCLITPDRERTMRTFPGASKEMSPNDLNPGMFEGVRLVHIEGYTILNEGLAARAMELAKAAGAIVSFDLASFEIVNTYKRQLVNLLSKHVDILFGNAQETYALTGAEPHKACKLLKDLCDISVVLMGRAGCWVGHENETFLCPAFPVEVVDTTGAGDFFISGFLHGYLQGHSLEECARYGSILGSAIVGVKGAELPSHLWDKIKSQLYSL